MAILGKEIYVSFASLLGWTVTAVFLLLSGFYFHGNLWFFAVSGGFDLNRGLWQYQFHDMRYVLVLIAPLVTMRLFAEERRQGTLELLSTYPVSDVALVAGKYAAALILLLLMLALTLIQPVALVVLYPVDPGPLLAGYAGLFLLGAAFLSCGIFVSSLTDSQIVAGTVTFAVLVLLWVLNWNEAALGSTIGGALREISLFDRFYRFARGAIDLADAFFLVAFSAFFLFATVVSLRSRRQGVL